VIIAFFKKLLFGDQIFILHIPSSVILNGKRNIWIGEYYVQIQKSKIIVARRNPIMLIAGLPSLYCFIGKLDDAYEKEGIVSIAGIVTFKPLPKTFLSIWFGLLLLFLTICLAQAILLASRIILSLNSVSTEDLAAIGFMLGSGALTVVFGVAVLAAVRFIFKSERQGLIAFCCSEPLKSSKAIRDGQE